MENEKQEMREERVVIGEKIVKCCEIEARKKRRQLKGLVWRVRMDAHRTHSTPPIPLCFHLHLSVLFNVPCQVREG